MQRRALLVLVVLCAVQIGASAAVALTPLQSWWRQLLGLREYVVVAFRDDVIPKSHQHDAPFLPTTELLPVLGHAASVHAVDVSPDGARIVSSATDGTVRLWDLASGRPLFAIDFPLKGKPSIGFLPSGEFFTSGGEQRGIHFWDPATRRKTRTAELGPRDGVLARNGSKLIMDNWGDTLLWDLASGKLHKLIAANAKMVGFREMQALSDDGAIAATVTEADHGKRYYAELWDAAVPRHLRSLLLADFPKNLAIAHDKTHLLVSFRNAITIFSVATGEELRTLKVDEGGDKPLAVFAPRDKAILAGKKALRLIDAETGTPLWTSQPDTEIETMTYAPDGQRIVTGHVDGTVRIWDAATGALLHVCGRNERRIADVAFVPGPDGTSRLVATTDMSLAVWDVAAGALSKRFDAGMQIRKSGISADGTEAYVFGRKPRELDDTVALIDLPSGVVKSERPTTKELLAVSFATGRLLVSLRDKHPSQASQLELRDLHTDAPVRIFDKTPDAPRTASFFDGDGSFIAQSTEMVSRWNTASSSPEWTVQGGGLWLRTAPDNRTFTTSYFLGHVLKVHDVKNPSVVRTLEGHSGEVKAFAYAADSSTLLSGAGDHTARLWDVASGRQIQVYRGHLTAASAVAFSPDEKRVVAGAYDGTVKIWDRASGALLATLVTGADGEWLAITPEGFFGASSPEASRLLSVTRGLAVYGVDQFWQALYRPDLVREKLAGDPAGKVKAAAAALDLDKVLETGDAPVVAILSPGAAAVVESDLARVSAQITDTGAGIGRVEWRINGVTVGVSDGGGAGAAKPLTLTQDIALDPGDNVIEVVAYNGPGLLASPPAKTTITWTGSRPSARPRLHVLAVGINDYYDSKLKLTFAVPDARSLASALSEAGKDLYDDVAVTLVLDKNATIAGLEAAFNALKAKIRPRDVFIFYAAGHGKTEDGHYYLVPQDFKYDAGASLAKQLAAQGIGQERLQAWFAQIPAKKSILMFDTCESGSLTGGKQVAMYTARGGLEQLAAVGRLIQATGRTTLTASMDDQSALEGYRGHGVFTFALLDALARGDRDGNKLVEVTELVSHVDALVPEITERTWKERQIPRSLFQGSNFAVARQLAALAPAEGEQLIISSTPTHVVAEATEVLKEAQRTGAVLAKLKPFTAVTLVKTEAGWSLIAKEGKVLGFIRAAKLQALQ